MPKGDIVGIFTGRVCLSLMERSEYASMAQEQQRCWQSDVDRVTGRVCMENTTVKTQKRKLRRDSALCFTEAQTRSKSSGLAEGSKVEAFGT
jgi:hypothetical protein